MEEKVSDIDLKNLKFIDFSASKMDATFEMRSRWLSAFDKDVHMQQWLKFADVMWDKSVGLFTLLCGFIDSLIHLSFRAVGVSRIMDIG